MAPMTSADATSRPVPISGRRHRPTAAVMMNSTITKAAMPARMTRLGMVALTSVYEAPVIFPELSVSVAYWSNQMLTACSPR